MASESAPHGQPEPQAPRWLLWRFPLLIPGTGNWTRPRAGPAHDSCSRQHRTGQQPRLLPPLAPPRGGVTEPAAESLAEQGFLTWRELLISFLSMGHASAVKCVDSAWSEIPVLHFLSRSVTRCSVSGAHPPAKTRRRQTVVDSAPRLPGSNSDPRPASAEAKWDPGLFLPLPGRGEEVSYKFCCGSTACESQLNRRFQQGPDSQKETCLQVSTENHLSHQEPGRSPTH